MHAWTTPLVLSAAAITILGVWLWKQKKKRTYVKVGRVTKLYFFPVKSLKAVEVTSGRCTKKGFEVNGYMDRSFMLVSKDDVLVSQREAPSLALLTAKVLDNYVIISGPEVEDLKIEVKKEVSSNDTIKRYRVHSDSTTAIDCGDTAAAWFQKFLEMPDVRLVQYIADLPKREYLLNNPYYKKFKKEHPVGLQDDAAIHLISQPSLDDLNSRTTEKISVFNFRPNILVDECQPYDEDMWKFMKFSSGAELSILLPTSRCLLTTNNPETGKLSKIEPLTTLRKYRIPKDPKVAKLMHHIPCFGETCAVVKEGEINVGDEIYAVIEKFSIHGPN